MALLQIMNFLGHEPHEWDPDKPGDLDRAKRLFADKLKLGMQAYRALRDGTMERITQFDPKAERIILRPPMGGG
jgi:hypothetical protein